MTDGKASDVQLFKTQAQRVKSIGFSSVIGLAAGKKAKKEELEEFCDHVALLETMDGQSLANYFKWVSDTVRLEARVLVRLPN